MHRTMVVYGTRPEAIKVAPVIRVLRDDSRFDLVTVATAQHRHMLDQVIKLFDIVPDVDLDMLRPRQTLPGMTQHLLAEVGPLLRRYRPDIMLVQGDTTTAFTAALAAFYEHTPVATSRRACVPATSGRRTRRRPTAGSSPRWPRCTWRRPPSRPRTCWPRPCRRAT